MNIDVEAFGLYLAVIVAGVLLVWSVWPAVWRKKKEELALDPVPEPAPAPVAEIKPAPVPSLEPVVAPEPIAIEQIKADMQAMHQEAFVKAVEEVAKTEKPKSKKTPVKKETSFVPPAAPKPKKAPAKKAPKK